MNLTAGSRPPLPSARAQLPGRAEDGLVGRPGARIPQREPARVQGVAPATHHLGARAEQIAHIEMQVRGGIAPRGDLVHVDVEGPDEELQLVEPGLLTRLPPRGREQRLVLWLEVSPRLQPTPQLRVVNQQQRGRVRREHEGAGGEVSGDVMRSSSDVSGEREELEDGRPVPALEGVRHGQRLEAPPELCSVQHVGAMSALDAPRKRLILGRTLADSTAPSNSLDALGYSEFFRAQVDAEPRLTELRPGRVIAQHRGEWDVLTARGVHRSVLAGRLYEERERPAPGVPVPLIPTVGDWVLLAPGTGEGLHVIEHTLTRRSHLERGAAGRRREPQTIVANVDDVVVVCQLPPPGAHDHVARRSVNPRRIERYLSAVAQGGAEALIALNKADLCPEADSMVTALRQRFAQVPVIPTSATTEDGLDELREHLRPGSTVGLVGLSGVGKSSIVNALLGRTAQKTGAEREQDARGRHTTTHRELFLTESGVLLIDTPGMREFALSADEDDVGGFEDVNELAATCRFRDCRHRNEPGCSVLAAVLGGQLARDRLDSYHALTEELSRQHALRPRGDAARPGSTKAGRGPGRPRAARGKPR